MRTTKDKEKRRTKIYDNEANGPFWHVKVKIAVPFKDNVIGVRRFKAPPLINQQSQES